jgi:hypothetical protein
MPDEKPFRREELPKVGWIMSKLTKNLSKLFFSISPTVKHHYIKPLQPYLSLHYRVTKIN